MNKKGRPRDPGDKVYTKRRYVPRELAERVDEFIRKAAMERLGLPKDTPWPSEAPIPSNPRPSEVSTSMDRAGQDNNGLKEPRILDKEIAYALSSEVDRLKKENGLLLDGAGRDAEEIARLNLKIEKLVNEPDEKTFELQLRLKECERKLRSLSD